MSNSECEHWHGAMAMDALGTLESSERAGLLAHLDGCPACNEEARDLASYASLLALVESTTIEQAASVSPELTGRVLGELHRGAVVARRRRRAGVAMATVGVAIAASLVVLVALGSSGPTSATRTRSVALVGKGSGTATASLAARTWGTAVTLTERGQPAGIYSVSMRTSSGVWWETGSYSSVPGKTVDAQMACGVPLSRITGVRVTDANGVPVLWNKSASAPIWW